MTSQWTKESFSQIDINGARLAYEELGQGETMVLVHPNISDLRCWDLIKPKLGDRSKLTMYSRRYHRPNNPIAERAPDP